LAAALAATADIWAGKSKYAIRVVPRHALRFGNLLSSFRPAREREGGIFIVNKFFQDSPMRDCASDVCQCAIPKLQGIS
jgi:hypothetical protein